MHLQICVVLGKKEKNAFIDLRILKASSSLTGFYPIKLPNRQQSTF
jgi:hypothetical protein